MSEIARVDQFAAVLETALALPDLDVAKLEKLLDMQERIVNKAAEQEFNQAMVLAQESMPAIKKTARNEQTKSNYTPYDKILQVGKPIAAENGFAVSYGTDDCPVPDYIRITAEVMHRGGFSKHYHYDLPIDNVGMKGTANKTLVHGSGSTSSYGRRYLFCMIFNIATTDDNDAQASVPFITEDQLLDITSLLDEITEKEEVTKKILNFCSTTDLAHIPAPKFKQVMAKLEATRANQ